MYGLGVGIWIVFLNIQPISHLEGGVEPQWPYLMYYVYYLQHKEQVYGLGVGISIVFEIFSNFPFLGAGLTQGAIYLMYCIYCL